MNTKQQVKLARVKNGKIRFSYQGIISIAKLEGLIEPSWGNWIKNIEYYIAMGDYATSLGYKKIAGKFYVNTFIYFCQDRENLEAYARYIKIIKQKILKLNLKNSVSEAKFVEWAASFNINDLKPCTHSE